MEYLSLEASRRASSLFPVAWISFCESSATAIFFHRSSLAASKGLDLGLFLVKDKNMDLNMPLGLAIDEEEEEVECLLRPLLSSGTTEIFSRACGRHLLQRTAVVPSSTPLASESDCLIFLGLPIILWGWWSGVGWCFGALGVVSLLCLCSSLYPSSFSHSWIYNIQNIKKKNSIK